MERTASTKNSLVFPISLRPLYPQIIRNESYKGGGLAVRDTAFVEAKNSKIAQNMAIFGMLRIYTYIMSRLFNS